MKQAFMPTPTTPSPSTAPKESLANARLRHSLWLALEHTINRYLLSCSHGRWSGAEKATRHIELCNHYVAVFKGGDADSAMAAHEDAWRAVHDTTQALTDHMDVVIGFPSDSPPDYDALAPKFFAEFHRLALAVLAPAADQPGEQDLQRLHEMLIAAQMQTTLDEMHSAVVSARLKLGKMMDAVCHEGHERDPGQEGNE